MSRELSKPTIERYREDGSVRTLDEVMRDHVVLALGDAASSRPALKRANLSKAARLLGVGRTTLYRWLGEWKMM